jgi:hypothetical protein
MFYTQRQLSTVIFIKKAPGSVSGGLTGFEHPQIKVGQGI